MWGLSWPVGALACAAWLIFAAAFRYSSLAALLSVVVAAIAAWFLASSYAAALLTLLVPLVWARHHENIAIVYRDRLSAIAGHVPFRDRSSDNRGNHAVIRRAHTASPAGGPPGTKPSAMAGARYFRIVFRSQPRLSLICT